MLELRFEELAEANARASAEQQRAAAQLACEIARSRTGLAGREVEQALRALRDGRYGETFERVMIRDLTDRLEREAQEPWGDSWRRSRAAHAISYALLANPLRAADGSIYQAYLAVGEDFNAIEPALRAIGAVVPE